MNITRHPPCQRFSEPITGEKQKLFGHENSFQYIVENCNGRTIYSVAFGNFQHVVILIDAACEDCRDQVNRPASGLQDQWNSFNDEPNMQHKIKTTTWVRNQGIK